MSHASYLDHGTARDPAEGERNRSAISGDAGHGRNAVSASQIPWKGWKDILIRTYQQFGEDRLLAVAAGVVFYGLLALFPAITAIVSSYALFARGSTIAEHMSMLAGVLPEGGLGIVRDQVDRVLAKGDVKLGLAFLFSFVLAVWSANGGMKAIIDALNVVYDEDEKRGFFKLNAISLAFTFGGLVAVLLAIGAVVALPIVLSTIGLGALTDALFRIGRWPVLVMTMLVGLAVLYRFGPSRPLGAVALAQRRQRVCNADMAGRVCAAFVLSRQLCELRRDLRLARCRDRLDDVDVDVRHCRAARRRTQFGNRASDRGRQYRRRRQAVGPARGQDGRYGRRGESIRAQRAAGGDSWAKGDVLVIMVPDWKTQSGQLH